MDAVLPLVLKDVWLEMGLLELVRVEEIRELNVRDDSFEDEAVFEEVYSLLVFEEVTLLFQVELECVEMNDRLLDWASVDSTELWAAALEVIDVAGIEIDNAELVVPREEDVKVLS